MHKRKIVYNAPQKFRTIFTIPNTSDWYIRLCEKFEIGIPMDDSYIISFGVYSML